MNITWANYTSKPHASLGVNRFLDPSITATTVAYSAADKTKEKRKKRKEMHFYHVCASVNYLFQYYLD